MEKYSGSHTTSRNSSLPHNRREEKYTGKNVDRNGIHEQWFRVEIEDLYEELFSDSIEKYNAKQKRNDRKMNGGSKEYLDKIRKEWDDYYSKGLYENGTKNMKAQDLQNRIEQIRKYEPVLSVSIHQNSYSDPGVKGPQVFYYEDSEGGKELALAIQENMNRKLSIARPRVAKGNRTYYLLKRSPGVINIVECGFLTNPEEAALLQTEKYQRKVAEAVADGIVTYLKKQKENENN